MALKLNKMDAVEEIVKIREKEGLKIGALMKKEKRQNGCGQDRKEIRREKSLHEKYIILEK